MAGEYSGRLLHGRPHGRGQLTCDNGDVIVGEFVNGLPHGLAKRTFTDGSTYEGDWIQGSMSGAGTLQQANGDRYEGMWFRGLRSSAGTQTWARPATASGAATVKCSPFCSSATRHAHSCATCRYDGQWAEDMMHGEGTLYQRDGSYYKGSFASGQMNGRGKQVTVVQGVETEVFDGSFLRGQRHNEGLDHRVGRSDTRLWYNHGRLLRRQVSQRHARTSCAAHPLPQVLCQLPHHHALIVTVSSSSRPTQPPGGSLRYNPRSTQTITPPRTLTHFSIVTTLPFAQAARLHLSRHPHARLHRGVRDGARALSHGRRGHFQEHKASLR